MEKGWKMIKEIYKSGIQEDMDVALTEFLQERINDLLDQIEVTEPELTTELMYKACDLGQEVGFETGFKTAFQLIAECLL